MPGTEENGRRRPSVSSDGESKEGPNLPGTEERKKKNYENSHSQSEERKKKNYANPSRPVRRNPNLSEQINANFVNASSSSRRLSNEGPNLPGTEDILSEDQRNPNEGPNLPGTERDEDINSTDSKEERKRKNYEHSHSHQSVRREKNYEHSHIHRQSEERKSYEHSHSHQSEDNGSPSGDGKGTGEDNGSPSEDCKIFFCF